MPDRRAAITALGTHVPERVRTNADLEKIVDTTDEWIRVAFAFWRWTLAFVQGDLLMAIAVVFYGLAARRADPALSHQRDGTHSQRDGSFLLLLTIIYIFVYYCN